MIRGTGSPLSFGHEPDDLGDHLVLVSLLSVFRLPPALSEAAIDDDAAPFIEVLAAVLGLFAEDDDVDETDVLPKVVALLVTIVDGQAEIRDGGSAGRVAKFRIPRQVADQDDFVEARHRSILPILPRRARFSLNRSGLGLFDGHKFHDGFIKAA